MTQARVLFAGTPEFALASFEALTNAGILPVAVLTQPDRPAGRGKRLTASPVKRFALELGIEVMQPPTLKDPEAVARIAVFEPDILVVAAYGLILPQSVLDIPSRACVNVHASLLPRWRGAAPIQAAILAGDAETGISLMAVTAGLDCGPVYAREALAIGEEETAGELHDRLAMLGGELLGSQVFSGLAALEELVNQGEDDLVGFRVVLLGGRIHRATSACRGAAGTRQLRPSQSYLDCRVESKPIRVIFPQSVI